LGELNKLNIDDWLQQEDSVCSSRMKACLETMHKHENENIIVFTTFRTSIDVFSAYLPKHRPNFTISSGMSSSVRTETIKQFNQANNGILLLSFDIGCQGLNLQSASVVLITSLWWNCTKTIQAVGRVLRREQRSPRVSVYFYASNTGIEKAILRKHKDKAISLETIKDGPLDLQVETMKMDEIVNIITQNENPIRLEELNQMIF